MIINRVLVFNPYPININAGGPAGFIAHNLIDKPKEKFLLLSDLYSDSKRTRIRRAVFDKVYSKFSKGMHYDMSLYFQSLFWTYKCNQYKYIYFHDCTSLASCLRFISSNQVIILQSHSPELPSEELIGMGADQERIDFVRYAERKAFERADIVVFPNDAVLPLYSEVLQKEKKVSYILSGAKRQEQINKYPLDKSTVNFFYIGRRNEVKGFDIVIKAFCKAYESRKDLRLIIAGGGIKINESGIVDIGFINNPHNWYNSVDYVVNANRKSYFDLSVIEALQTGVPIILSNNFGHSYYENKSLGIATFDSNDIDTLITTMLNSNKTDFEKEKRADNIKLYESNLTDYEYYKRFQIFIEEIL